jgi:hypothetical protein
VVESFESFAIWDYRLPRIPEAGWKLVEWRTASIHSSGGAPLEPFDAA